MFRHYRRSNDSTSRRPSRDLPRSAKDAVVGFATAAMLILYREELRTASSTCPAKEVFLMVPPSSHEGAAKALAEELQELGEHRQRGLRLSNINYHSL